MQPLLVYLVALTVHATAFQVHAPLRVHSQSQNYAASTMRRARTPWVKKLPEDVEREAVEAPIEMESSEQYEFSPEPEVIRDAYGNVVGNQSQRPLPDVWGMGSTLVIGNDEISYTAVRGARQPAILYLSAFDSPSRDFKAERIQRYCEREEYSFISMEWYGVGQSDGDFEQGTISRWKQDAMTLISKLLPHQYQKLVIVGGGVGGWIATLIGLELPNKVTGIVGLAADPDFTHNLLLRYLPRNKMEEIETKGMAIIQWGQTSYPVTQRLIEDAGENLVLQGPVGGLPIHCPVRLIHGLDDEEVPYTVSLDLARRLASPNVNLYLVKTANHHLDNTAILDTVIDSIEEVIANAPIEPQRNDIV